jgi:hypothetical protein
MQVDVDFDVIGASLSPTFQVGMHVEETNLNPKLVMFQCRPPSIYRRLIATYG